MDRIGWLSYVVGSLQDHMRRIEEEEMVTEGDGLDFKHLLGVILKIDFSDPFQKQLFLLKVF